MSDYPCDGGDRYKAAEFIKTNGFQYRKDYTAYLGYQGPCKKITPKRHTIGYSSIERLEKGNEDEVKREVAENGPISCAVRVSREMENYLEGSKAGTFSPSDDCSATNGYHAMVIVGYGTDEKGMAFWLLRNSWGEESGLKGYVRLQRGKNACGIADNVITLYG